MSELIQLQEGQKVGSWTITKKLGEGGFGAVYLCKGKDDELNALKVEAENDPHGLLRMEVYVLMELKKTKFQARHFLGLKDRGNVPGKFNYVVMTLVGKSLQELRNEAPMKKFSMGTAISVGRQCLEALEDLHNVGILHRDIKPGNYTIGRKELNELRKVYMLDFGMARKFVKEDGTLRNPRARAGFRGTVKYAPLACHVHREQCRKDDIESWMYMLVEITCGRLPWRNLTESNDVGLFKKDCKGERYRCLFGGCPREYTEIFPILDKGKFFDAPDYPAIYKLLELALQNTRAQEFPYDWEM
uniref:non-specific serine/threonine protein kinase n=1 Tax=Angiostrongylus cantonensis TaxID=6313 RepID=A0A158P692_ANGCA